MRRMSTEHWLLLGGFLGVLGVQLTTMGDSWAHVASPSFVGATFVQFGLLLRAMFSDKPGGRDAAQAEEARRRAALENEDDAA